MRHDLHHALETRLGYVVSHGVLHVFNIIKCFLWLGVSLYHVTTQRIKGNRSLWHAKHMRICMMYVNLADCPTGPLHYRNEMVGFSSSFEENSE